MPRDKTHSVELTKPTKYINFESKISNNCGVGQVQQWGKSLLTNITNNDEDRCLEVLLHFSIVTVVVHDYFDKRDARVTATLHIVISHPAVA